MHGERQPQHKKPRKSVWTSLRQRRNTAEGATPTAIETPPIAFLPEHGHDPLEEYYARRLAQGALNAIGPASPSPRTQEDAPSLAEVTEKTDPIRMRPDDRLRLAEKYESPAPPPASPQTMPADARQIFRRYR